jgi:uncharacterized protein (DUF58 family)
MSAVRVPSRPHGSRRTAEALRARLADSFAPRSMRLRLAELERRFGVTRPGRVAFAGALMLWGMARLVAGTGIYLAAYGVVALIFVSALLAPRRLRLRGSRQGLFPRAQEGDRLEVQVRLEADRRVSTFTLEERLPERLGTSVRVPITRLAAGSAVSHRYALRCGRRGVYQVGPLVAVARDPLGLYQRQTVVAQPFELLVHPRYEHVSDRPLTRQFEDPPIRPPVSKPWPSGLEFYGMREYERGDDLRRIVWRASARTGTLMVREAEQGITDRITLILDTDRGAHVRDSAGYSESFETAIRTVASLGVRHLRDGYELRVECNGGPLVRPLRGGGSQLQLLDALTRLGLDREPLTKVIMRLVASAKRDAHNVLVTPRLGPAEAAQLKLLLNTGVSIMVVALLFDEEDNDTVARAAALGCQVTAIAPGQDIGAALYHDIGAGSR